MERDDGAVSRCADSRESMVDYLEGGEFAFVLGFYENRNRRDSGVQQFVCEGTQNDVTSGGAVAVATGFVDGISDDGVFEAVFGSDKPVEHFAGIDADSEVAGGESVCFAALVYLVHL